MLIGHGMGCMNAELNPEDYDGFIVLKARRECSAVRSSIYGNDAAKVGTDLMLSLMANSTNVPKLRCISRFSS